MEGSLKKFDFAIVITMISHKTDIRIVCQDFVIIQLRENNFIKAKYFRSGSAFHQSTMRILYLTGHSERFRTWGCT